MVTKQLNVDSRWTVIGYEQSIGVYNVTATDGMGKEFVFRGFDMEELKRQMTDAINAYDKEKGL
jgi:hypothetical protein